MRRRWVVGLVLTLAAALAAALAACDRASDGSSSSGTANGKRTPTTSPFSKPATTSSTSPATTQVAESLITIDGNMVLFPAAKLRVDDADGKAFVRLFSDDPKGAALDPNYVGNSFYLQLDAEPDDAKNLNGVTLKYQSTTHERDDTPYGIFLEGRRWVLQPADVTATFSGARSPLDVQLSGKFLLFDTADETAKPKAAEVTSKLSATVQTKK